MRAEFEMDGKVCNRRGTNIRQVRVLDSATTPFLSLGCITYAVYCRICVTLCVYHDPLSLTLTRKRKSRLTKVSALTDPKRQVAGAGLL